MSRFMNKNRLAITIIVSTVFILVVGFFSYVIYSYGFYDNLQNNKILESYNTYDFDTLYPYLDIKDNKYMNKKTLNNIVDLMYNKLSLKQIYDNYYADSGLYKSADDFINEYYYGYGAITFDDIDIEYSGKSTLFTRRKALVKKINIKSAAGTESIIGTVSDTTFIIDSNAFLQIDNNFVAWDENICNIDYMFGGVHLIEYASGDFVYVSLVNIYEDKTMINVEGLKNLIPVAKKISIEEDDFEKVIKEDVKVDHINPGLYALSECKRSEGCPESNSYISINVDNTVAFTRYYNNEVNNYSGTYKIINGFLIITFDNVDGVVTSQKVTFKINEDGSFNNNSYLFTRKA